MQEKATLQKAMQAKNMLALYRDELCAEDYAGIPVAVEDQLLVLQKENNFTLDGYAVLRTGDITLVEQVDESAFCRRAFTGEGVYESVAAPGFPCRDWRSLLSGIKSRFGGWLLAQCEGDEDPICYVGRIVSVDERYLTLRQVDADGSWHADSVTLPLDDLTLVCFGDRYLSVFQKYCKN